jgi:hypothetical protein
MKTKKASATTNPAAETALQIVRDLCEGRISKDPSVTWARCPAAVADARPKRPLMHFPPAVPPPSAEELERQRVAAAALAVKRRAYMLVWRRRQGKTSAGKIRKLKRKK